MTNSSRCKKNGEAENIVLIDLESDSLDNANINIPSVKKPQRSNRLKRDRRFPSKAYIYIDDDDDDDNHSGTDDTHSSQKNRSPVKLSKNKRMYPGRGPTNCYGFNIQSDDGLSDDSKKIIHEKESQCADAVVDDALVESSVVNDRQKLKETDEYKLAQDEELSARQKALKIQAEEAQEMRRLLKRKKAETLRLLDTKRRQKQRVEEIRESQKMVHAAYKRALLMFHPDRAAGSDMRKLVEAEEKFKLISRMKDKVRNTPCLK